MGTCAKPWLSFGTWSAAGVVESGQGKSQKLCCTTTAEAQEAGGGWITSDSACDAKKLSFERRKWQWDGKKGMVIRNT